MLPKRVSRFLLISAAIHSQPPPSAWELCRDSGQMQPTQAWMSHICLICKRASKGMRCAHYCAQRSTRGSAGAVHGHHAVDQGSSEGQEVQGLLRDIQSVNTYRPSRPNMSSHSASSPYCAQYSRKPSLVVENETPNTIIFADSLGGPSAPGRLEFGMSGIADMIKPSLQHSPRSAPVHQRSLVPRF